MASSTYHYCIFMLIIFLVTLKTSSSFKNCSSPNVVLPFLPKHVVIVNKLVTRAAIVVHCRNKGKDLGARAILPGERFGFKFRVNLRKTTTYTCIFSWPGNTRRFDIFRADRDDSSKSKYQVCYECIWYIFEQGPCRIRRDGGSPFCFPWAS